ncbi:hypothetical protein SAPIO_CDS4969 [Scedosporium apiospermum]|uniref:Major facilitator superfamily (MFS) profile domain-containing protein n=1 Tax=Pseudallescheria apiosperma TaxID=563466 RepID=A0A084G6Y4_PSEDA|nr:uncharacterized protein SAPIO_CDS4969 [Scedosporium apiospermum]KEZ43096.1 hypothetical protein SAPIO_CDS4969 [Scedosporium apiospermum]
MGARAFLSTTTLVFGGLTIAMGFATSWTHQIPIRLLLGVFENGILPGVAYLTSCWYPRFQYAKRSAGFFIIGLLSSAFSGILSYAFSQMGGVGPGAQLGQYVPSANGNLQQLPGIAGWRWIFFMQGVVTVVIAALAAIFIIDFPEHASKVRWPPKFLTEREAELVVAQINKDRSDVAAERFNLTRYLASALDLKIWMYAIIFGTTAINTFGVAYFLPVVLRQGMGFSTGLSQLLVAPPYVVSAMCVYISAWAADKYHYKGFMILAWALLSLVGLSFLALLQNVGVRYLGAFVATSGVNTVTTLTIAWQANNKALSLGGSQPKSQDGLATADSSIEVFSAKTVDNLHHTLKRIGDQVSHRHKKLPATPAITKSIPPNSRAHRSTELCSD